MKPIVILSVFAAAAALTGGCHESDGASVVSSSDRVKGAGEPADLPAGCEKATFAAGCFWGVEAAFRQVEGVVSTCVGYTGGSAADPTYKTVCTGRTGHAEAVQVTYDPSKISYEQLLDVFWNCHDPTTPNRQGPDVGTQYRSAIFFHNAEQESAATASKADVERTGRFKRPIVTQIVPATAFYPAEEYHQQYLAKRGRATCQP